MTKLIFKIPHQRIYARFKFPRKLEPQDDELLSSWLVSLALRHRTMPATFTNLYLPQTRNKLWATDLDLQGDQTLLDALSDKSGLPINILEQMTIRSYEGYLFEKAFPNSGATQYVIPLRMRGRRNTSYGIRYCPRCFQEDERPYFRRKWRLSFSTACLKHSCFLLDRCPSCKSALTVYRRPLDPGFPNCDKCGFRLMAADVETIDARSYGLTAIRKIYEILDNGFVEIGEVPVYSFLFFGILHHLSKAVYFWDMTKGLLDHEVMKDRVDDLIWAPKSSVLEEVRLKEQFLLYSGLMRLFEVYPDTVLNYCDRNGLGKTELTRDLKSIPYWFTNIVDRYDQSFWPISSEEVSSALKYMSANNMETKREQVEELMGRGIDFRKRKDIAKIFGCC